MNLEIIKKLRTRTGVGVAACKRALEDSDWNIEKATKLLQESGEATSIEVDKDTKAQGFIASYQHHNGKIVAVVELRCETDFMARGKEFKELAEELAMHVAAANPQHLSLKRFKADNPARYISLEEMYKLQANNLGKPEHIIEKIALGKVKRWAKENCLETQELVTRDNKTSVLEAINLLKKACGETIWVERFSRIELGV